jgi:hypothetical protein
MIKPGNNLKQDLPAKVCCNAASELSCRCGLKQMNVALSQQTKKGNIVKLPLISAFLVVYILLAASWISYSQLIALY